MLFKCLFYSLNGIQYSAKHPEIYIRQVVQMAFSCVYVANAVPSVPSRQKRLSGERINVRKVSKI